MEVISNRDREILRRLAAQKREYAEHPRNEEILRQWNALGEGKRESPTARLLFSNFRNEAITPRLLCEGKDARQIESTLRSSLVGRELFDDDTPISPTFELGWKIQVKPFGIDAKRVRDPASGGYHIEPVIEDVEEEFEKFQGGGFRVDRENTLSYREQLDDLFGDILPTRMVTPSLGGSMTNPLVHLIGMENYYLAMYDCPEALHKIMDMATKVYENYYDFLEREQLLSPTCGISPLHQESFAFNHELPTENVTKTTQCWGFLESQETTAVSPETFGEFVFPYQDRLVKRFGLLSYGCCERVDAIFPDYLSQWKNLRKLSVSPFNNENQVGEYLRGSKIVYYSKPRADLVTHPGPLDEDALRKDFQRVCTAASGCLFEIAQREVMTLHGDMEKGRRYVKIAKECVEQYWKP
ncbi:MAG: hypothetical protein J6M34_02510 [Clostridia bacterium]|nr:hypothetical protein [Clostridia bacterium]